MEMLGRIRWMYLRDKVSLHEIAKRTGLSRNTVRRLLRAPEEVQVPTYSRAAGFSKLSGFIAELEQSLKADTLRPKQNRRTGRALFAQIKASGYVGGYTQPPAGGSPVPGVGGACWQVTNPDITA